MNGLSLLRRVAGALLSACILGGAAVASADPVTLSDGQVLRGRFVQERSMKGFDQPVRSEGRFVLAPGRGLIWQGETPFPVTTAITPAGIVQSVEGEEVMRQSAAKVPFLARLYDMMGGAMAGNWQALEADFTVAKSGEGDKLTVVLTPRRDGGPAQPFSSLTARMGRFVDDVTMVKADGDQDLLRFSDQQVTSGPLGADELSVLEAAGK